MYAIVDIETTGSNTSYNRVIEVSVFHHDGKKYAQVFNSLVDPGVPIPGFITGLTGITNCMLEKAPTFEKIADRLYEVLKGKVFVAHNVNFDFNFLKTEFEREGIEFNEKKLCTVRLSRKIIPGLGTYSLGSLCSNVGIRISDRHRAAGDAAATAELLTLLLNGDNESIVEKSLKKNSKEATLPPNLSKDQYEELPDCCGVYYFHDQKGKVLYIGKSINIKKRITAHFNGKSSTRERQDLINNIHSISWELCGNELVALLHECNEIRKYWPKFNKEFKKGVLNYGIFQYEDQSGYSRLVVNNLKKGFKPLHTFSSYLQAREYILEITEEYKLNPYLSGISTEKPVITESPEDYNLRLKTALTPLSDAPTIVIKGNGRDKDERSFILIEKGAYKGYGYYPFSEQLSSYQILSYLKPSSDNPDIQRILRRFIRNPSPEFIIEKLDRKEDYQAA